jgi:hypothetical protein
MQKLKIQEIVNKDKVIEVNRKQTLVDRTYTALCRLDEFQQLSLDRQGELTIAIVTELQKE